MVQNAEDEEKPIANGEIKTEVCDESEVTNESEKLNGHASECEESDDDDYLDHLLMLPLGDSSNRNRNLVSKCLLDFCSAIENKKEYQKIKQELLNSASTRDDEDEHTPHLAKETPNLAVKDETLGQNEVTHEEVPEELPLTRRHSIRLKRAMFVPEHEPSANDQFFVCRRCTIFFRTRKLRKEHNLMNHRRKANGAPVVCEKQKLRLRRSSSNKDPLICDLCQKQFKQKGLLRSHMAIHLVEPQFFCSLCPYASKRNSDLRKHHEMHHNPDRIAKVMIRKRKCEQCDEILNGKKAFKLHMREKHPQESPAKQIRVIKRQCEKCEEILEGLKAYRLHMKHNHSELSVIRCETCHRKFKTNFRLKKHQNKFAETGLNCRVKFRQSGEKPTFDCQQCEKKFLLKSHLSLHMKKHTNLTCEKCNATFKNKFNLKWHEFSHLEIEPKCSNCVQTFTSEQKFAIHLKKKICKINGVANGTAE